MPDILTPAERRLIDAYPKRKIKRIPAGVTGEEACRWDGATLRGGDSWAKQITGQFAAYKRRGNVASNFKRASAGRARREKLRAVYSGQTAGVLAQMFGVSDTTINSDLKRLRMDGWIA